MKQKNRQKLNRAAVAAVMATSGAVMALPNGAVQAASPFKDLSDSSPHYKDIMNLYNRGYISGFSNGTFQPNQAVTRGQAAVMLARMLGLNTTSPQNPNFKDIPTSSPYYKYVAALAGQGIISGFLDGTFRPNETMTREQMAIVITRGFQFRLSTSLTHPFKDVLAQKSSRYYIQTLYDLQIAKGSTAVTFEPSKAVTRGQMASFLIRAENANANTKRYYEIGGITGSTIYINGVKHTIAPALRGFINATNAEVLMGAHIEGSIVNNTLQSISKLTINAQGTASRLKIFEGANTTFSGELEIRGNYLRFNNWTVAGLVKIADAPPRTIAQFSPRAHIASLNTFSFIDWGTPTTPDDTGSIGGSVDGSEGQTPGGETTPDLEEKPSPGTEGNKKVPKMANIQKFIDFANSTIRRVEIAANGTSIEADKVLPHVTVTRTVRQFEVFADMTALYLEADVNTKMYGIADVKTAYKNSYKSVDFVSDTVIEKMIIDNSYGWIDLGEYVYVNKAIIPPNKMPFEIFNDFLSDSDLIGDLEDPTGEDVDRDPVDNTIVPDLEDPSILSIQAQGIGSTVEVELESDEDGIYYYMIVKSTDPEPSVRQIITNNKWGEITETADGKFIAQFTETGLQEETNYRVYAVIVDEAGNVSDKDYATFITTDGTPPVVSNLTATPLIGGRRAQLNFRASEEGQYFYAVVPQGQVLTVDQVINASGGIRGTGEALAGANTLRVSGLNALTPYTAYVVMKDRSGNTTVEIQKVDFTTTELDDIRPTLDPNIQIVGPITEPTVIRLTFSEQMDKETVENVMNYTLGGTGNLRDQPYSAKLESNGRTVLLEIPSMAAFVNNDTLTVTVKGVTDASGNFILENAPTSVATFRYSSTTNPAVSSLVATEVTLGDASGNTSVKTDFTVNYPGTYHYMIVPIVPVEGNPPTDALTIPTISQIVFPDDYKVPAGYSAQPVRDTVSPQLLNDKTILYGKGTANVDLNSFTLIHSETELKKNPFGYRIYMVLQDRNGNFSSIKTASYLPDANAPKINQQWFVNPNTNEKETLTFFYKDGYKPGEEQIFEFRVEFDEIMDKASVENKDNYKLTGIAGQLMTLSNVSLDGDGKTAIIRVKGPYRMNGETYSEYLLKPDNNVTIEMNNILDKSQQSSAFNGSITFKYVDKVKPIVTNRMAPRVYYAEDYSDSKVMIELTFSENVKFPAESAESAFELKSSVVGSKAKIESGGVAYKKDELGKDIKNKIVLTLNPPPVHNESLTITATPSVVDEYNNPVFTDENALFNSAVYTYRNIYAKVDGAQLSTEQLQVISGVQTTPIMYIVTTVQDMGEYAKIYFTVRPKIYGSIQTLTVKNIIESTSKNSSAFGVADTLSPGQRNELDATETSGDDNAVFVQGYVFYMAVIDEYKNVSTVTTYTIDPAPPTPTP